MSLYQNIKTIANEKGVSINMLEKKLGFARGSISKFDKNVPGIDKISAIANELCVSVDCLTSGGENENKYYLNDETAQIAQEIFENPDMKSLFDMSRKMSPERLRAHLDFMKKLYDEENH